MADPRVVTLRPEPGQYAWTFGGAAPLVRVTPPAILEVFTEDCFAGRVRGENDLVSQVCEFPYLNPQTGPFYVEGAEPGDTLAVHFISIEPARDWGASTTVPLFGALSATHATALVIVIVAVYILMNAACIGFFARPGHRFNPWLHAVIPVLGILAFVPAWLTSAGIDVLPGNFITPLPTPYSYMGPGVAGFMIIGVIYLIYLYRRHPQRVVEVGLVHLDPLEEYEATDD